MKAKPEMAYICRFRSCGAVFKENRDMQLKYHIIEKIYACVSKKLNCHPLTDC